MGHATLQVLHALIFDFVNYATVRLDSYQGRRDRETGRGAFMGRETDISRRGNMALLSHIPHQAGWPVLCKKSETVLQRLAL